jgi:hypothetical protein
VDYENTLKPSSILHQFYRHIDDLSMPWMISGAPILLIFTLFAALISWNPAFMA